MPSNKKYLTVAEAAEALCVSKSTIRRWATAGRLDSKQEGRFLLITRNSVKSEKKRLLPPKDKINRGRRNFLAIGTTFLITAFSGGAFFMLDFLDKLKSEAVEVEDLFPYWSEVQVVPGQQHPVFGFHPDTKNALESLAPLARRSEPLVTGGLDSSPRPDPSRELVLIGTPITNPISTRLHGYRFEGPKISVQPNRDTGLRWCFYYPIQRYNDPLSIRYVYGEPQPTMPKAIRDRKASKPLTQNLFSRHDDAGFIRSDYLLLTVVPNSLLGQSTGSTIIDVSDLQGQGTKTFAKILRSSDKRKELAKAVKGKRYFQALYEVPVSHDFNEYTTTPGEPKLNDVHIY